MASRRWARTSKSSGHFCLIASIRNAASLPKALRPPPGPSATLRRLASFSKYSSLTCTSARMSAHRQLSGKAKPARTHVSSSSQAFSARKPPRSPNSTSMSSSLRRRPRLPSRSTQRTILLRVGHPSSRHNVSQSPQCVPISSLPQYRQAEDPGKFEHVRFVGPWSEAAVRIEALKCTDLCGNLQE